MSAGAQLALPASQGWDRRRYAFWGLVLLGGLLRFAMLGQVPAGLNSDEASTGVEALSILRTGMDRWGNHFPIWFPAWGSGMNALYSYIAIPVIARFGLSVLVLRAIGAVFGLLTLPVAYQTARLYFGRDTALLTLAFLALLPWHVMSSRWALDSNLAPLFFTLGLWTIGKALRDGGNWPLAAFIPWSVATYAYPAVLPPEAIAGLAILILFRRQIQPSAGRWSVGLAIAFLIELPFLLFLAKNQLHFDHLPFESTLPFALPALPASRLGQLHQGMAATIVGNLTFILSGFRDGALWHHSRWFAPLTDVAPYLILIATLALGVRCWREGRPNVILIVTLTAIVPLLLLPLNVTRFNWFYIPAMMAVANLFVRLESGALPLPAKFRRPLLWVAGVYFAVFTVLFVPYYFTRYNGELPSLDRNLGNGFRIGLEVALRAELALARPDEPMLVEVGTVHPYLYPLFYGLADIETFQATRQVRFEDGVYRVSRFGRFYFEREALPPGRSFVFASRTTLLPCAAPEIASAGPLWAVGRCSSSVRQ